MCREDDEPGVFPLKRRLLFTLALLVVGCAHKPPPPPDPLNGGLPWLCGFMRPRSPEMACEVGEAKKEAKTDAPLPEPEFEPVPDDDYLACLGHDRVALVMEETVSVRLHLAMCEEKLERYMDALRDARDALELAMKKDDPALTEAARKRTVSILSYVSHVRFEVPDLPLFTRVESFSVDGRPVPADGYEKQYSLDAGEHRIWFETASLGENNREYTCTFKVAAGETVPVRLPLPDFDSGNRARYVSDDAKAD